MDDTANLIGKLHQSIDGFIVRKLEEYGIKGIVPSHGHIMAELFKTEGLTMKELAFDINKDPSTVTTLVKKLIGLGYLEIKKDGEDKRSNLVFLSAKGKSFEEDFKGISEELYAREYRGISDDERAIFRHVLKTMTDNFNG